MKKSLLTRPLRLLLGFVGAGAITLALLLARRGREPIYQEKPLSYWVEHLSGTGFARSYDAIRAIGPDAVPWLLAEVRSANSMPQRAYFETWDTIPLGLRKHLPVPKSARAVDENVAYALSLLDSKGLPALIAASGHRNKNIRRVAALALGKMLLTEQVVAQSVPGLSKLLTDPDQSVRAAAVGALDKMDAGAKAAVPILVEAIQKAKPEVGPASGVGFTALAIRILGRIGPDAADAVPELRKLLKSPHSDLRANAAVAVWRISRDTNMAAVITAELDRSGVMPQLFDLLLALSEMGPAARVAVPILTMRLQDPRVSSFSNPDFKAALDALRRIDQAAAAVIEQRHEQARLAAFIQRTADPHGFFRRSPERPTGGVDAVGAIQAVP